MRRHRLALRAGVGLLTVGAVGTVAVPAQAAAYVGTVAVERSSIVAYVAQLGVIKHNVSITRSGRTVTIDDSVQVKAGTGCSAVSGDKTKVRCTLKTDPTWLRIVLGGYDDVLVNRTDISMTADSGSGNDRVTGGSNRDIIDGNLGADAIWGMGGNDDISDSYGNNALSGGDGADLIFSGFGNDRIYGGNGDDSINGFLGNDIEDGGPGNDRFFENGDPNGSADADSFIGGAGNDYLSYQMRTKPVTADADAVHGDDGAAGEHDSIGTSVEAISGGSGNDRLIGTTRNDILYGESGNDVIAGSTGNDLLIGGPGRDYVNGAGGSDQCERGTGDTVLGCES